jgi:Mrp family chromosome partitioning ATPase
MGRVLETLKQTGHRRGLADTAPAPCLGISNSNAAPSEAASEIPFIEVGGRGAAVEGSAAVLAAAPVAARSVARATQPHQAAPTPVLSNPLTVAYQPLAASAPHEPVFKRLAPSLIAFHQPNHAVSAQYRALLAGLTGQAPCRDAQVLLLTAPTSGTGATTVLLNLAITRARLTGKAVAVVDANLRRPAVAERLGLPSGPGLREVAIHRLPLSTALRETAQAGLMALTAGEATSVAGSGPASEAVRAVIQQLRSQFDWIVVDTPSWDGGPDMVTLGSACDAVYLVLRPTDVDSPVVNELGRLIPHLGTCLGGYIVTQR